jgi:Ca2+-binding EF-hand superfamily protein
MKILASLSLVALAGIGWTAALRGQTARSGGIQSTLAPDSGDKQKPCPAQAYTQDAVEQVASTAEMSAEVKDGYRLFRAKCGYCHSLNQRPTKSESSVQDWTNMVFRMRDMPSSHMSEPQAKAILKFVIWEADFSNDMVKTLMAFDKDGDGKLSRSEVPERMQGLFDRGDTNKDGFLTPEEIRRLAEGMGSSVVVASKDCDPEQRLKK